jgi:DNA-binding transcriptional regulator YdaS (Cro superfamily)
MKLKEYIEQMDPKISMSEFARRLEIHPNYIWLLISGKRHPSEGLAHEIVRYTKGAVTYEELRKAKIERERCPHCGCVKPHGARAKKEE